MGHSSIRTEFILLIASMTSLVALTTDIMLPALGQIAFDLGRSDPNDGHLVISVLFAGYALGQLIVGPLSNTMGRRPVVHGGYVLFALGCVICLTASAFEGLLAGRFLQGVGMAGPRIVAMAIVRDQSDGRTMARIMSFVMAVFILVPAVAPALGQVVISLSHWRGTFWLLLITAAVTWTWFSLRQPETLAPPNRRPLSARAIRDGIRIIVFTPAAIGYTVSAGLIFGPFLGYLSMAQQIFQTSYETGPRFALWFAAAALSIGAASIVNSHLVECLGMRYLSNLSLVMVIIFSAIFGGIALTANGLPPFGVFMTWLMLTFFCMGLLFGNLNALAMDPLGKMAGLGAAIVGALSTAIAIPVGAALSQQFDGSVTPLILGFGLAALACTGVGRWVEVAGHRRSG
jgi:DHA1 family bicyclomycin/chloramphenicol resistance-like MFS transporter